MVSAESESVPKSEVTQEDWLVAARCRLVADLLCKLKLYKAIQNVSGE